MKMVEGNLWEGKTAELHQRYLCSDIVVGLCRQMIPIAMPAVA
jgi:hypothetical protein